MAQDLLSGLAQGLAQGKAQGRNQKLIEDFKKTQKKLLDAQVDATVTQHQAREKFASLFQSGNQPEPGMEGPPSQPGKPMSIIEALSDPEGQMLAIQAGLVNPMQLMPQNTSNVLTDFLQGGNKDFVLEGVKFDSKGNPLLDFKKSRLSREVPAPDGTEIIQLDQFGKELGRRPIGPNERTAEALKEASLSVQQQFKLKPALSTVDQLETLYNNIISAKGIKEKAIAMKLYDDFVVGTIAPLVKAGGESGNLATEDIERALKLPPGGMSAMTTFTSKIGEKKFENLREWFKGLSGKVEEKTEESEGWTDAKQKRLEELRRLKAQGKL